MIPMRYYILAWLLFALGCVSIDGNPYPACADVYKLRPEKFGKVFCHLPSTNAERAFVRARSNYIADTRNAVSQAIQNTKPFEDTKAAGH